MKRMQYAVSHTASSQFTASPMSTGDSPTAANSRRGYLRMMPRRRKNNAVARRVSRVLRVAIDDDDVDTGKEVHGAALEGMSKLFARQKTTARDALLAPRG